MVVSKKRLILVLVLWVLALILWTIYASIWKTFSFEFDCPMFVTLYGRPTNDFFKFVAANSLVQFGLCIAALKISNIDLSGALSIKIPSIKDWIKWSVPILAIWVIGHLMNHGPELKLGTYFSKDPSFFVLLYGSWCVYIAFNEEIIFRGTLLPLLNRLMPLNISVFIASIVFGLVHFEMQGLAGIIFTFACSFVWCFCYIRTGSLLIPIVTHFVFNIAVNIFWSIPPNSQCFMQ